MEMSAINSGTLSVGTGVNPQSFLHRFSSPCGNSYAVIFIS